jgi:hypothetical protein
MPKVTIEYNLPDEQDEFEEANNARKYYSVLWELDQYLRNKTKYADEHTPELFTEAMHLVRDEFWKLMNEHNLDLNK